jgi:hypothetical protein
MATKFILSIVCLMCRCMCFHVWDKSSASSRFSALLGCCWRSIETSQPQPHRSAISPLEAARQTDAAVTGRGRSGGGWASETRQSDAAAAAAADRQTAIRPFGLVRMGGRRRRTTAAATLHSDAYNHTNAFEGEREGRVLDGRGAWPRPDLSERGERMDRCPSARLGRCSPLSAHPVPPALLFSFARSALLHTNSAAERLLASSTPPPQTQLAALLTCHSSLPPPPPLPSSRPLAPHRTRRHPNDKFAQPALSYVQGLKGSD